MSNYDIQTCSDQRRIEETLNLAAQSVATAYPGPMDACLLVSQSGTVVWETADSTLAESPCARALRIAGREAAGATAYLILEPSIFPPIQASDARSAVEALLDAGVTRVVGCMESFDATVAGRGYDALRGAGINVQVGVHEDAARRLNRAFAQWYNLKLPYVSVLLRLGRKDPRKPREVIRANAVSTYLRHAHDAVLTDIEEVLSDTEELFLDTSGSLRSRALIRLIYDPTLSIDPEAPLVASWNNDLILLTTDADADRVDAARGVGIAVETFDPLPASSGWKTMLESLSGIPIQRLLVESSDRTILALLEAGLVNELIIDAPRGLTSTPWSNWFTGKRSHELSIPNPGDSSVVAYLLAESLA